MLNREFFNRMTGLRAGVMLGLALGVTSGAAHQAVAQAAPPTVGVPATTITSPSASAPVSSAVPASVMQATTAATTPKDPMKMVEPPPAPGEFSVNASQLNGKAASEAAQQQEIDRIKREQDHIKKSYERASDGLLPLSPEQIQDYMRRVEDTYEASRLPSSGIPKGQVRIVNLSLEPGAQPPQVNLASGYVTTINLMDASGEPWPILDVGVGGSFEVSPTQAGTHVVRVMPLAPKAIGNLSILLKDLPTPVIFKLDASGSTVDMRFDARVPKYGPSAKPAIISRPKLEAGDESMILFLQNIPPQGAKRIKVGGGDARTMVWTMGGKVYVRTPLALLSPAWNASVSSNDGLTVYEVGDVPVLLMSDNGALVRAKLLREDDHD